MTYSLGTTAETAAAAAKFAAEEGITPDEMTWLDKFQFAINDFLAAIESLRSRAAYAAHDPALKNEYDSLMSRAGSIQGTINTLKSAVNEVTKFFTFSGLGNVGFLPLLPIAAIAGAVALIAKWTTDAYSLSRKLDEVKRLQDQGMSAQEAAKVVSQTTATPLFGGLGGLVPLIAVGGLLWFVLNHAGHD